MIHPSPRLRALRPLARRIGLALVSAIAVAGPGAVHAQEAVPAPAPPPAVGGDPMQGFNRASFAVGMGIDKVVIGPVTHAYMAVTPRVLRDRVSDVVYNIGEPSTVLNLVLQGHGERAVKSTGRFVINSTVGVAGLFDVADKMGIHRREADFGQTFGRYGARPGAYVYVPVLGPLNVRDGTGRVFDLFTDPVGLVWGGIDTTFGQVRYGVTLLDTRATADPAYSALKDATDPYTTLQSAYGQHRAAFVREASGQVEDLPDFDAPAPADNTPQKAPSL
jgi:phospholipid-binding lipoprotein MlaA